MTTVEPQAAGGTRDQLVDALAALGSLHAEHGGVPVIRIPAEALEQATHTAARTPGTRLADMFAGGSGGSSPWVSTAHRRRRLRR
jgi:hypothetical protein